LVKEIQDVTFVAIELMKLLMSTLEQLQRGMPIKTNLSRTAGAARGVRAFETPRSFFKRSSFRQRCGLNI
jgi:hypothetical protein